MNVGALSNVYSSTEKIYRENDKILGEILADNVYRRNQKYRWELNLVVIKTLVTSLLDPKGLVTNNRDNRSWTQGKSEEIQFSSFVDRLYIKFWETRLAFFYKTV